MRPYGVGPGGLAAAQTTAAPDAAIRELRYKLRRRQI